MLNREWSAFCPYHGPVPPYGSAFDGVVLRTRVRVYYEDTDFSGIVYHANYLRYAERARSDFLRHAGADNRSLMEGPEPMTFVVSRMEMDFLRTAHIEDELDIQTTLEVCRGARYVFAQRIGRGEEEIWRARLAAASVEPTSGKPRRLRGACAKGMAARLLPAEAH